MDVVVDGLWIGSLECANDTNLLSTSIIGTVISLGCRPDIPGERFNHVLFPDILDRPESVILHILPETNKIIANAISNGEQCLVHCVYGQSRSATVCVAYMISTGMSLATSLEILKNRHSNICINPGFLGQLYLYSEASCTVEHHILTSTGARLARYPGFDHGQCSSVDKEIPMLCRHCGLRLSSDAYVLPSSPDYVQQMESFIGRYVDGFWKGYTPLHPPTAQMDTQHPYYVVQPAAWMLAQVLTPQQRPVDGQGGQGGQEDVPGGRGGTHTIGGGTLCCPDCNNACGFWAPNRIRLCIDYVQCDLFAVWDSAVRFPSGKGLRVEEGGLNSHIGKESAGNASGRLPKKRFKRSRV